MGAKRAFPPQGHDYTEVNKSTSQHFAALFWLSIQVRISLKWRPSPGWRTLKVLPWDRGHRWRNGGATAPTRGRLTTVSSNGGSFSDLGWDQKNMQMIQTDRSPPLRWDRAFKIRSTRNSQFLNWSLFLLLAVKMDTQLSIFKKSYFRPPQFQTDLNGIPSKDQDKSLLNTTNNLPFL